MLVAVHAALGLLAGAAIWRALAPALAAPALVGPNIRGSPVPASAGVAIVLGALAVEGGLTLVEALVVDLAPGEVAARRAVVLAAAGFGLLGLLDDLAGAGESGGFRAHLGALARGRLTTGAVKLFGGAALALAVTAMIAPGASWRLLADAALVALAANLANLLDRAPGRAAKAGLACGAAVLVGAGAPSELAGVALVLGAAAALALPDLRERCMLGDTGANVLGATAGLGVVLACSPEVRTVVLVGLAALNLASEAVSFSGVIDSVGPLRWLDRLGRAAPPSGPAGGLRGGRGPAG